MTTTDSRFARFHNDYSWQGVEREAYKQGAEEQEWQGIVRQVLVGKMQEATAFQVRYFEIAPGGYSSLEKHEHTHVVIAVRGKGKAILGKTVHMMAPLDAVYVAPWTPHQFLATAEESFGFLCIVEAERDSSQPLTPQEQQIAITVGAMPHS